VCLYCGSVYSVLTRIVACNYSQVFCVDFNTSFTPVINHAKLVWKNKATILDIETAFHCSLDDEIHIDFPRSLNFNENQKLALSKTIYSLEFRVLESFKVIN
jgi:hypothetical protein